MKSTERRKDWMSFTESYNMRKSKSPPCREKCDKGGAPVSGLVLVEVGVLGYEVFLVLGHIVEGVN